MSSAVYELVEGDLHTHAALRHAHPHSGPHRHDAHSHGDGHDARHSHAHGDSHAHGEPHFHGEPHSHGAQHSHGHAHGLIDASIKRSREGVRAVALALALLGCTAALQALVFALTGSIALLADLIHNGGDALTAVPLGIAFALRSERAERLAGLAVVSAIFASACIAAYAAIARLVHPSTPDHLVVLALAGAIGFAGNWVAGIVRTSSGRRLRSHALIADGDHARVDAYVSLAVIASALAIAAGAPVIDPIIGLGMSVVILRITLQSWRTVRGADAH